jgi:hemerythrin superfamily protein
MISDQLFSNISEHMTGKNVLTIHQFLAEVVKSSVCIEETHHFEHFVNWKDTIAPFVPTAAGIFPWR